jgi:hypothetical protein
VDREIVGVDRYIASVTSNARKPNARKADAATCPECCAHGVALVWFCSWCAELEEFGTSDFGVWGAEMVMPCEHTVAAAS